MKKPLTREQQIYEWKVEGKGISWARWCALNGIKVHRKRDDNESFAPFFKDVENKTTAELAKIIDGQGASSRPAQKHTGGLRNKKNKQTSLPDPPGCPARLSGCPPARPDAQKGAK